MLVKQETISHARKVAQDLNGLRIIPFVLMPQTLIYGLGIERFQQEDVEIATRQTLKDIFCQKISRVR
jgi:hypothetical protein